VAGPPARFPLPRQLEAEIEQSLADAAGDHHGLGGGDVVDHRALAAGGEQSFGRLAYQHEVEVRRARVGEHRQQAGNVLHGPHAGVQAQIEAQVDLRCDLGAVGIAHGRQPHGREQNGIGPAARIERRCRQGLAVVTVVPGTSGMRDARK
jgi:hypothetical protein